MRLRRLHVATAAAIAAAVVVPAFAASLGGLSAGQLGAGDAVVSACDSDGFSVSYTTSSGNVTAVNVSGIADPGCEGGDLSVTLADASGAAVGSGGPQTVAADGDTTDNSMTVTLSPTPAASVVTAVHVVVAGP